MENKNIEYNIAANEFKNILNKKARASEIRSFNPFDRETQTYHINMLNNTRVIGDEAYKHLLNAKEKLEIAEKKEKQNKKMSSEIAPLHKKATQELEKAEYLRKYQENLIFQKAQEISEQEITKAFKSIFDNKIKRLEDFYSKITFSDSKNLFDMFNKQEKE